MNTAHLSTEQSGIRYFEDSLSNGLTVVTVEMPRLHQIELAMFIRAGLRFETEAVNGISHFLEHMMFRGNAIYPDSVSLNREFEKIGRDLRASTLSEYTYYGFNPHPSYLNRAIELFARFFEKPTFPSLEVEREIILEECQEDLNEKGENININNLACGLLYPGDPLAWPTIGTDETIRGLNAELLGQYFEAYYHPGNMVFGVAGPVDHANIIEKAKEAFGKIQRTGKSVPRDFFQLKESQAGPVSLFQQDSDSQIQLQVCFRGLSYNHPDYNVLNLISRMFDDGVCSRLQRSLREDRGLVYSVECRATCLSDTGTLDFDVMVRPEKAAEVLKILFEEIKSFLTDGPVEEELRHVQNRYCFDLEADLDDPGKMMVRYGFTQLYSHPISVEEEREQILAVTLDNVKRVAQQILVRDNLNVIAVGPVRDEFKREVEERVYAF